MNPEPSEQPEGIDHPEDPSTEDVVSPETGLPTMADLDGLAAELDAVDATLIELDQQR